MELPAVEHVQPGPLDFLVRAGMEPPPHARFALADRDPATCLELDGLFGLNEQLVLD